MNKPSERIVVFVTTAQKRAITAAADNLGISVSELMRRAVLSFGATSEQVKAASIVDRLRAPREPDALDAALQRVARGTRHARAALPAAVPTRGGSQSTTPADRVAAPHADELPETPAAANPAPLLPAGVPAALAATAADEEAAAAAEAVARVTAAKAAATAGSATEETKTEVQPLSAFKRPRLDSAARDEDDPHGDPSTEGGRFA
ncbi:hypothetical protein [Paraburkholderia lacunae]|uniref:Uncharacterized protein n=1 Tax=Paraburkholderia lacunae TaxID=2211104 RepID=A0A370N9Z3_9BURK|nr:hypothetical protein [Paraburkholderia lacunae]RDK02338.1 hypothetical protein DLM46_12115 [Paraburkholderia lacunae]